jgi:hypothetical protein
MPLHSLWEHPVINQVRSHTVGKRTPPWRVLGRVWWRWLQRLRRCHRRNDAVWADVLLRATGVR